MSTDLTELNAPDHFSRGYETHEVLNHPGFLADYDAYSDDKPLLNAVNAFGGSWAEQTLRLLHGKTFDKQIVRIS